MQTPIWIWHDRRSTISTSFLSRRQTCRQAHSSSRTTYASFTVFHLKSFFQSLLFRPSIPANRCFWRLNVCWRLDWLPNKTILIASIYDEKRFWIYFQDSIFDFQPSWTAIFFFCNAMLGLLGSGLPTAQSKFELVDSNKLPNWCWLNSWIYG